MIYFTRHYFDISGPMYNIMIEANISVEIRNVKNRGPVLRLERIHIYRKRAYHTSKLTGEELMRELINDHHYCMQHVDRACGACTCIFGICT